MKKSELNLNILKKSLSTLKECYEDLNAQEDEKIKNYIESSHNFPMSRDEQVYITIHIQRLETSSN